MGSLKVAKIKGDIAYTIFFLWSCKHANISGFLSALCVKFAGYLGVQERLVEARFDALKRYSRDYRPS